ncbi:Uncharacterised protein [Streptococcus equi subsp. equi]|uniref:Nucleotidyltransferase family protein n=2 Tax=Streptococcus equi TaxID=1336 RepID=A0A380JQT1_9STRE|nr:nucleotidyltransferase family protein [Streptococcus equi]SUN46818.1 Uncharacterised protein [Streptococcus equi subsp. equi]
MKKRIISLFQAYLGENTQEWLDIDEKFLLYHHLDMFYYYLCKKNSIKVPLIQKFETRKKSIENKNNQYLKLARELNTVFEKQSIQVAFLKGIQTSEKYYEKPWIRYYSDLDILVDKQMISRVKKLFFHMGYVFGKPKDNGEILLATREEILYQNLFTHEIYNLVKKENNNLFINIDVNFLFSWKGLNDPEIKFNDIKNNIIYDKQIKLKTLDKVMNFIHLSCHLYNEARYFALDKSFSGGNPQEIQLNRVFELALILKEFSQVEFDSVVCYSKKLNCDNKIFASIAITKELLELDLSILNNYTKTIELQDDFNTYVDIDQKIEYWPISVEERVFDLKLKEKICKKLFIT